MSLMPPIRLSVSECYVLLAIFISFNREIISPYFCCIKKKLVYIIVDPFSRQPSSCVECTKLNIYILYNIHSVSFNKYAFPYCVCCCTY